MCTLEMASKLSLSVTCVFAAVMRKCDMERENTKDSNEVTKRNPTRTEKEGGEVKAEDLYLHGLGYRDGLHSNIPHTAWTVRALKYHDYMKFIIVRVVL